MAPQRQVREPTLFFSAYVHKHLPGFVEEDPRALLLEQADRFVEHYDLPRDGWPYQNGADVDLVAVHRSPPGFEPLVNRQRRDARSHYSCLAFVHLDAIVIQVMISLLGQSNTNTLLGGWQTLRDELLAAFDGEAVEAAEHGAFGTSAVYWGMAGDTVDPADWADEARDVMEGFVPRLAETDLGPLWERDVPLFSAAPSVFQDRWVLVTPDSKDLEREVNARYSQVRPTGPCPFAVVALARHKVAFERAQHLIERENLELERTSLDRRARWIIDTQAFHGEGLSELRSPESLEFQQKLARAHRNLADYSHTATRIRELRRTVEVNRENFLVNCPALVSGKGATEVASSVRQPDAAAEFLAGWQRDHAEEIFRGELGRMHGLCEQLDADIDYSEQLIRRHSASLASGGEQLQIAGERELGEISSYHALEAAAVVAALAAVVTVELLRVGGTLEREHGLSGNALLLAVTGAFALVMMLAGRGHAVTRLQRWSFATAAGFAVATIVILGAGPLALVANAGVVAGAAVLAWGIHLAVEAKQRARKRRETETRQVAADVQKLVYAAEELPRLLEDLPPSTTDRLKGKASLEGKLRRENAKRARERHITEEELAERGEAATERDVTDVIGIRYVVGPSKIAERVERVRTVTHPDKVDYKNVASRVVEGPYRGFCMKYKSIHIDVDLWGVGARRDVNLMAEIQVRTYIQDLFANWFHDLMYKPGSLAEPRPGADAGGWRSLLFVPVRPVRRFLRCAQRATAERRGGGQVTVTERDGAISVAQYPVSAGKVTFGVRNEGETAHDLSIKGPGLEDVATGVVLPGAERYLTVELQPGEHTLHYSRDGQAEPGIEAKLLVSVGPTSPWLVLFFDAWHPWLNRPLARALIWLSDLELRLLHRRMEWNGPLKSGCR